MRTNQEDYFSSLPLSMAKKLNPYMLQVNAGLIGIGFFPMTRSIFHLKKLIIHR